MPLTQEQQDNIHSFLSDKGEQDGTRLAPDTFPGLLFKYWDEVTNPQLMFRQAKRRTLRQLKRERDRQDTDRPGLEAEIAALEAEVGP
jgi:hypothetical protein